MSTPSLLGTFLLVPILLKASLGTSATTPTSQPSCKNPNQLTRFALAIQDVAEANNHYLAESQGLPPNATVCKALAKLRPNLNKEPQKWQQVSERKLMVFSAYLEEREAADGPAIRIIGSGFQQQYNHIGALYCQLWYEKRRFPVSVGPALYTRIYPSTLHPDMWVSHFVICKLPNNVKGVPVAVSVVPRACDNKPGNQLLVLNREKVKKKSSHAVCISPMYNSFREWENVVEWLEMNRILGAREVTLYNFSVSAQTNRMLESYLERSSIPVNVVQWPYPPVKSNVWCQRGALNDCLYRMGHRHKYVTITDMDEILVPRKEYQWKGLISRLHKESPDTGAFLFQHAYYRRNVTDGDPKLITQTSFWRTNEVTPPGKIRSKAMYDTEKAVSIDLHFPYLLVPGAKELILDPHDGMLHHYRPYPMEDFRKNPERYTFIEDRFMLKYKEKLVKAVKDRIERIREL